MIIFAGPSLKDTSISLIKENGHILLSPVKRGDIKKVQDKYPVGEILIVDGIFHQQLSVGHEEILYAIKSGWSIHGVSSMGAIRAYELRNFGMKGHGKVYQRFLKEEDFQDDEVALIHLPAPGYQNISEPLVHFRACVEYMTLAGFISSLHTEEIISVLKMRYFGTRTLALFNDIFHRVTGKKFSSFNLEFEGFREKKIDLIDFLKKK